MPRKTVSPGRGYFRNLRSITCSADGQRYAPGELEGLYEHLSDAQVDLLLRQKTLERIPAPAAPEAATKE